MSAWTQVRFAARDLRRNGKSSVLSMLLLALPIVLITVFTFVSINGTLTLDQRIAHALGAADARVSITQPMSQASMEAVGAAKEELAASFNGAIDAEPVIELKATVTSAQSTLSVRGVLRDTSSNVSAPLFELIDGAWPSANQVAISSAVAERLSVAVGDQLSIKGLNAPLTVSGLLIDRTDSDATIIKLQLSDEILGALAGGSQESQYAVIWLVTGSPETVATSAVPLLDRRGVADDQASTGLSPLIMGLIAFGAVMSIMTVAIFTALSRRQRQTLGILSLVGAERTTREFVAFVGSAVLGLVAALVGTFFGLVVSAATYPAIRALSGEAWPPPTVSWAYTGLVIALTVLVAVVTGWRTARNGAKYGARQALGGREDEVSISSTPRLAGASVATVASLGAVAVGGALGMTSLIVLASFASAVSVTLFLLQVLRRFFSRGVHGPIWLRIAVRDSLRAPARARGTAIATAALVTLGVMTAFVLSSLALGGTYVAALPSNTSQFTTTQQVPSSTIDAVRTILGADDAVQYRPAVQQSNDGTLSFLQVSNPLIECLTNESQSGRPGSLSDCSASTGFPLLSPTVAIAAPDDLEALLGEPPSPQLVKQFTEGTAITLIPGLIDEKGKVEITTGAAAIGAAGGNVTRTTDSSSTSARPIDDTIQLPAVQAVNVQPSIQGPTVLLPKDLIGISGLAEGPLWNVLFRGGSEPPMEAQDYALNLLLTSTAGNGQLTVERGDQAGVLARAVVFSAVATLSVATVVIISLFILLSSLQTRRDAAILSAVGVNRRTRRQAAGVNAVLGIATAVTVALGIGIWAASLVVAAENGELLSSAAVPMLFLACGLITISFAAGWFSSPARPAVPRTAE